MSEGVDYSTNRPSPRGLANVGKVFAVRYVGPGTTNKHLDPEEANSLAAAGVSIVAVAEGAEGSLLGGFGIGVDFALMASPHAAACGMPSDRPIYFAVDFDCTEAQWPQVHEALNGAAEVLGRNRVGVYGGFNVIEWAARDGAAEWFWQTYAWSGDRWSDHAHLRQTRNDVSLVGGLVDLDTAMVDDYGQWMPGKSGEESEDDMRYLREANGSVWREDGTDPSTGYPILWPVHDPLAWEEYVHQGATARETDAIDWRWYAHGGTFGDHIGQVLDEVKTAVQHITDTPMIDAVAVATAIAARPEIARTVAEAVAAQLATITGSITLSGSLSGGIAPPRT